MAHELPSQEDPKPFGDNGKDVGMNARDLWENLATAEVSPGVVEARTWTDTDCQSLIDWMQTEWFMPFIEQGPGTTEDEVVELFGYIDQLRAAIPFTAAERHWLVHVYQNNPSIDDDKQFSYLREQEIPLVSGGVRQVVQGRDLLRRWWSWRRQVDEFEGQGSLRMARDTLREISKSCWPGSPIDANDSLTAPSPAGSGK